MDLDRGAYLSSFLTWAGIAIATTLYLIYRYSTSTFDYFKSQGIPGPKPLPYVGNLWGVWKVNFKNYDRELIKKYGKNVGLFDGRRPNLLTIDPEIIKNAFVKDFDHFINRRGFAANGKVIRKMLTSIHDQEWKDVRSAVTPAFTAGKIKQMSSIMKECANRLLNKLETIARTQGKMEANMRFSAFTMDVVSRCAFGITLDNLDDKDDPFVRKAKQVFCSPKLKSPIAILPTLSPIFAHFLGKRLFTFGVEYFIELLEKVIDQRAQNSQNYHDFIEIATEAISEFSKEENGFKKPMWSKEEVKEIVIAQSVLFMVAGFDSTGNTLTSLIYLIAKHPDVQEKLYEQIKERLEIHGEVNHELILNFAYLDHVIKETLRMYPGLARVERICNRDVTYKGIHLKKGMVLSVPVFALHYEEDYYPDPETFNPDRWAADGENKPNPNAFMPFGMGPRNCIGMRFALEEIKIAACTVMNKFRFFPVAETAEKLEMDASFFGVTQPSLVSVGVELRA